MSLAHLTREQREELYTLVEEKARRADINKLAKYAPYPKQAEFHANGATFRERLLLAGNQNGKTLAAGCEASMHATGVYPEWWEGHRFVRPNVGWCASVSMEVSRDAAQRILLGRYTDRGSGAVPGYLIEAIAPHRSIPGCAALCRIRHVSGGLSTIIFKSYDQGRLKFQGDSIDWGWADEEPPEDIYTELLTRTNATGGILFSTFTPLLGMTKVVSRFTMEESPDRAATRMTINDALHYTDEDRERIINSYPIHERKARIEGLPMLGQGLVFPVARESIEVPAFPIPSHWPRIAAIDFGWEHPTAGAWLAWDRDTDTVYLTDVYGKSQQTVPVHAAAFRARGKWIPVMWPHDGLQHDKQSGDQLAQQYRDQDVAMWHERVTFADGTNGVEAGVQLMLTRMQTGRFKVFAHLEEFWAEFNTYHREDGLIVKMADDRICAARYALMGLRYAITEPSAEDADYDFPVDY